MNTTTLTVTFCSNTLERLREFGPTPEEAIEEMLRMLTMGAAPQEQRTVFQNGTSYDIPQIGGFDDLKIDVHLNPEND